MEEKLLLDFAIGVGEIMLKNGAETQRVENTMERILQSAYYNLMPETFVTPTGIFAGITGPLSGSVTKVKRIEGRTINLEKVAAANELSRKFVSGKISVREAFDELEVISNLKEYRQSTNLVAYVLISMCFTLLFNGTVNDALLSAIAGLALGLAMSALRKLPTAGFITSLIASIVVTAAILMFQYRGIADNYEIMIMGSIMPLVPGYAITNGAKDILYGDFISGGTMMIDAVLTAVFVAAGVGIALTTYNMLMGGAAL
jgi:uncharacterized membrane protein YjjP (DUF1212 family)